MVAKTIADIVLKTVKTATSKSTLDKVGKEMVERVKRRTRLGKGVKGAEKEAHPLPQLKQKTKDNRKRLKRQGKLTGPGATPAKSGLNKTGQMLESLDHEAKVGHLTLKLDAEGSRKAEGLQRLNEDFTFMNLSQAEVNAAVEIMEEEIKKKQ